MNVNGENTTGTIGVFGKSMDWGRKQATTLAIKFKEQLPGGLGNAKAEDLKALSTIVEGFSGIDIDKFNY